MKRGFNLIILFLIIATMKFFTGCKYDVAEPMWDKEFSGAPIPTITQVNPPQAKPGVNTITIQGENLDVNGTMVFFNNIAADVISVSPTKIVVRRPNLVTDSCYIKVVPNQALIVAKYGPFKIDRVIERYGSFIENLALSVIAVDKNENLYVVETDSRNIFKVTPEGQKSVIGKVTRNPTDARIGPGEKLYLAGNNRSIEMIDLNTGEANEWLRLPAGKAVKFGDFDANGYFYTGGTRTDLVIVSPNLTVTSAGFYSTDEILAIRVFNGYVYIASRQAGTQNPAKIWRHTIDANGNVGQKELVFDMSANSEFASRLIRAITFSENGTMFIATDSTDPILIFDPETNQIDYFYKSILPPYCKHFYWGNGSFLYLISGDRVAPQEWTIYRIDMGSNGAPYYGR